MHKSKPSNDRKISVEMNDNIAKAKNTMRSFMKM